MARIRSLGIAVLIGAAAAALAIAVTCSSYKYIKVSEQLPAWKTENLSPQDLEIESALRKCVENPKCTDYFKQFFTTAYLIIDDADSLCFTYSSKDDKPQVRRGLDTASKPELIVHLNRQNCMNLPVIFDDGEVSDEESYRIFRVTLLGSIRSELQMEAIYDPLVARILALPKFIQLTLRNEHGYLYQGTTQELTLSVVNVNGQWLAFEGAMGNPDQKMAFTHNQAADFRKLMFKMAVDHNAPMEQKKRNLNDLKAFFNNVTVYKKK